jgi:hypothetical protein
MTFVEKAREEAEAAPVHPGEEKANELLAEARESIYHWPHEFAGFSATLQLDWDAKSWRGSLRAADSHHFRFDFPEPLSREMTNWLNYQLSELMAHREAPTRSRMASRSGVVPGDTDPIFGAKVIFPGDPMESFYRIKNRKITQIGRCYPRQRFIINIDEHQEYDGRFAARSYTAFYWCKESGLLVKTESYFDDYVEHEELLLPSSRQFSMGDSAGLSNRRITLTDHVILSPDEVVIESDSSECPFH